MGRLTGLVAVLMLDVLATVAVRTVYGSNGVLGTVGATVVGVFAVFAVHRLALPSGRRFAAGAAAMVFLAPILGACYALSTYRSTYTHHALPALFGLSQTGWLALGAGLAVLMAFVPAPVGAGAGVVAAAVAVAVWGVGPLGAVQGALHENGWSVTFIEWLPVAGVIGLARKDPWLAVGTAGWLVLFVLRAAHRPFDGAAFWVALAPAVPAAALLLAAIALLVPRRSPAPRVAPDPR